MAKATGNESPASSNSLKSGEHIKIGNVLGSHEDESIRNCGPIYVGTTNFLLGVVPGRKKWYVVRNGKIFQYTAGKPRLKPIDPTTLPKASRPLWADALAREFLDQQTTVPKTRELVMPMVARYHKLVRAFVQGTCVDLAAVNIEREISHFARACCRSWHDRELISGQPTVVHATYVALALQLDDNDAAQLIEYAAFVEWRVPIIQREVAHGIYVEAKRMLATLIPSWWVQGSATDWDTLGTSIHDVFTKQFFRMANDAQDRGIPIEILVATRHAYTQLGTSPVVNRYLDRTDTIDKKALAELAKLGGPK